MTTATQGVLTMTYAAVILIVSCSQGRTDTGDLELPNYISSKQCDTLGRLGNQSLRESCMQLDEHQKELLKLRWNEVPDRIKQICIQRTEAAKAVESYASLASCVSDEIARSWLNGEIKLVPR